jgi:hypothetical protein
MDLSACPRYYSLGVAAAAFAQRIAYELTFFYAEAAYTVGGKKDSPVFTDGRWATVAIPFLSGLFDPGKKTFYLVSVGFEGEKTFRAVSRADPDRVSILFAKPGFQPSYEKLALRANRDLIREFVVPKRQIINAPGADAIAAWKTLDEKGFDSEKSENCFYMCCGTKTHALALALSAIASGYPAVLYNVPEEHHVHATKASGVYWTYVLRDMTAIV